MEFHISRQARNTYRFPDHLFSFSGNVILADFDAARRLAQRINEERNATQHPERAVKASDIYAMGLIDEILHLVVARYRQQANPHLWQQTEGRIQAEGRGTDLTQTLLTFLDEFPPLAVYRAEQSPESWLQGQSDGLPHRHVALEEMLMLWLANANPAFAPFQELFDDSRLEKESAYNEVITAINHDLEQTQGWGPGGESLIELLLAPAKASPHSLEGQLAYIRQHWASLIGDQVLRLLRGLDFLSEEHKPWFGGGPGPIAIATYDEMDEAPEAYSPDLDWMPRLVLLAKNTYVWLAQLSQQYGRPITQIDQIPDEQLATLAQRGITGLWLIGLWERSRASKRIKQMMGNPDAVASAYSLYDYVIAEDLGGQQALDNLRARAWRYGIRLASDMVPNHMAIDSRWVIEHPERFLSLPYSPFPSYTFNGPDLCDDARVGIFLEDHYYDHSDAAVVFKRVDYATGDTHYIYHGNDGTSMPWNDTAQLNYLDANVREIVIQTILHVARQFPIIRFDAAMTLAKRHIQRLWFPEPGSGGDIPSRAEHGLSKAEFDALMPNEFWREVVDRVAAEAPDTLLLAEAFWLLEGYFVRTLGMHRVYNSAFMHMLRDEDNDKYRQLIKNTLEFDPEILKRYVNFMSNPDEEPAAVQFGKGDKYFGICTVLATIPGLPMFGHGQFEGLSEKYGMEYRRPHYDESPDPWLIERHLREITPLLKRRHLFAEVAQFRLYDFYTGSGTVDENVLAYSNRYGDERALVLYHNAYRQTHGTIHLSAAALDKNAPGGEKPLRQLTLRQGLALPEDENSYVICRELNSGLEYLFSCRQMHNQGLTFTLDAYQKLVFLDFRIVQDDARGLYGRLHRQLQNQGIPDVDLALKRLYMQPLHDALTAVINAGTLQWLQEQRQHPDGDDEAAARRWQDIEAHLLAFLQHAQSFGWSTGSLQAKPLDTGILQRRLSALQGEAPGAPEPAPTPDDTPPLTLPELAAQMRHDLQLLVALPPEAGKRLRKAHRQLQNQLADPLLWAVSVCWTVLRRFDSLAVGDNRNANPVDAWLLEPPLRETWLAYGVDPAQIWPGTMLLKVLLQHPHWYAEGAKKHADPADGDLPRAYRVLQALLADDTVQQMLGVNTFEGIRWYREEALPLLLNGLFVVAAADIYARQDLKAGKRSRKLRKRYRLLRRLRRAHRLSGNRLDELLAILR